MIHHRRGDETKIAASETELDELRADIADMTPALVAFARRFVRNNADVEDLVQETIFRSLRSLHCFTPGTSLKSWLFTIMRNTFCTRYKLARRECVGLPTQVQERMSTPATQDWTLQREDVMRAVRGLDDDQRQALLLVAEGTSYADAAKICKCKIGTIKSRVNRAREALRHKLN
ncbi:sigma-70 family RNA polymerase sigma factor [Agrobacterium sp.]|jgi:RNA polymerase sigma-70 factor (ECF subfamily)|uniref:sigma-70 family RNA polymerase sigma factor n=1 Tax=Agrobacterium sp. TaxID=361 RepID=UPI0028AFD994|nr:sigma-70 family RNA polymerase sigma factor [Agrobacterium sp.]